MNNQKKVFIIAEAGDNHNGDFNTRCSGKWFFREWN